MRAVARGDDDVRLALQHLEVDVPDPRHIGAVGLSVVEADDEVLALSQLDRRAHCFVEAGGVLREHQDQVPAAKLDPLLPPECRLESAKPVGDVRGCQVDAAGGGVRGEHVVAVVQTPQGHLDSSAIDCQREAVEAV